MDKLLEVSVVKSSIKSQQAMVDLARSARSHSKIPQRSSFRVRYRYPFGVFQER